MLRLDRIVGRRGICFNEGVEGKGWDHLMSDLAQSRLPKKNTGALGYLFYAYWATSGASEGPKHPHPPIYSVDPYHRATVSNHGREQVRGNTCCACAAVIPTFTLNGVQLKTRALTQEFRKEQCAYNRINNYLSLTL